MQRLVNQLQFYKPHQLVVIGDFFHSAMNKELEFFLKWRNDFNQLHIQLVKGNHDILKKEWYAGANIIVSDTNLQIDSFCFVHDINDACSSPEIKYYFSGHIHPCITIKGIAKQALSLPCYYFTETFAVLPAFSRFTGTALVDRQTSDTVFAIIPTNAAKGQHSCVLKV